MPQNSGSLIFWKKKCPDFLKFIGPVTTLWVLYPSEIMHLGSTKLLMTRSLFAKSIKVLGWQPGAAKSREQDFPEKKCPDFLKFIGPVTTLWVLYPSEIMHLVFTEPLLARSLFAKSIKVLGRQPGATKIREHDFPKKNPDFFEIHRTSDNSVGSAALLNHAYGLHGISKIQSNVYKVN